MTKKLDTINNEIKSVINESKFISIKLRNKIIKMLGNEFDINLPLENYENIDITITETGNIIMRDEEYKRDNSLTLEEINERYNRFREQADVILKKKEINYQTMNDKSNIINLFITIVFGTLYIVAIIYLIRCFIYGNYFSCIWGIIILSSILAPSLRERFDRSINFIKRKIKK